MIKADMPAVKRRKLEKQKKIRCELKQELEREKFELLQYVRDRSKTATIVDDHFKKMQDEEIEVQRVLYGRMYNQQHQRGQGSRMRSDSNPVSPSSTDYPNAFGPPLGYIDLMQIQSSLQPKDYTNLL